MNAINQSMKETPVSPADAPETTADWVKQYERDGYCFPLKAMEAAQAVDYRKQMESFEAFASDRSDMCKMALLNGAYLLPFVDEITRLESILEPVRQILGPNVMVWNAGFFTKEPRTADFISWHQDLTYWGLSDSHEVTAWVALSPSTIESGCVKFVAGTHKLDIVEHKDTYEKNNLLSRGQEIMVEVKEEEAVNVELQPGEMSLHHGKVFHGSHANTSDDRRIGLAIRYISPDMRQTIEEKTTAKLVAGADDFDNFRQVGRPRGVLDPEDIASLKENMRIQQQFLYAGARK